ncbi:helix-turn-helix domain-containing protein [Kitasatospora sp. NPDC101801]|uniref:helix-turn-helix domain-containing protein n=1 Tax=Kitasatospora sp. NPDC101801 TaxID=3364103 RepID=UPI003804E296
MTEPGALFRAVDALLARTEELPPPTERARLRRAARLTQQQIADALRVKRETIWTWEKGRVEPRTPQREAYARLLQGLAERFPEPVEGSEPS